MFSKKPSSKYKSPLEKWNNPELDTTELLDEDGIHKYESLIGSFQWLVPIGRIYIATEVISLSSYICAPRIGYLERAQIVIGYLSKTKEAKLRFRVSLTDYSDISCVEYEWGKFIYDDTKEALPHDAPILLGSHMIMKHYDDTNLYHG